MKKVSLNKKAISTTAKVVAELVIAVVLIDIMDLILLSAVQSREAYALLLAETIRETWSSVLVSLALYNLFLAIGFYVIGKLLMRAGCITFDDSGVRKHVVVTMVVLTFIIVNVLAFFGGTINNCFEELCMIAKEKLLGNLIAVGCFDIVFVIGACMLLHHWSSEKGKDDIE